MLDSLGSQVIVKSDTGSCDEVGSRMTWVNGTKSSPIDGQYYMCHLCDEVSL